MPNFPMIIQGGMGVAVSNYTLARAVGKTGNMGVISGTGVDAVLSRRLQMGDPTGELKDAFAAFPLPDMAKRVWDKYFRADRDPSKPFLSRPLPNNEPGKAWFELAIVANFVEVWLAKREHSAPIGINLLEKIQIPHLASLFGAMLAEVDFVLMGAGIPRQIPAALDSLAEMKETKYRINVDDNPDNEAFYHTFDPKAIAEWGISKLKRPKFLAIISSNILALQMVKKCTPPVDGLIVEFPLAGGHNAPPRGPMVLDENNEPIYGPKDEVDLAQIAELGVPFWLAGAYGQPEKLNEALEAGACGIQVGTAFAFCNESGIEPTLKQQIINDVKAGNMSVHTNASASPTGFPFKVAQVKGTLSEIATYKKRNRICDLGYLRTPYRKDDGTLGYRCPSEPVEDYLKKGGKLEETVGRMCVCNGLYGTIGMPQIRKDGAIEPTLVTSGNDLVKITDFLPGDKTSYSAADVVAHLLSKLPVKVS